MTKFNTKPAIRDSFDEEEGSDDVDDEVFIRDGRNGYKMDEESGLKKPLMPLRRRLKQTNFAPSSIQESRNKCKMFLAPCCYGFAALSILLGLIALSVIIINYFPLPLSKLLLWFGKNRNVPERKLIPCTELVTSDVWVQTFPKLTSETAVRLSDVNHDGVLDIILGYGTGTDGRNVPDFVCTLYFGRDPPCLGGLVALNGKTGEVVWQHWTRRPVFSVDCSADLTKDGVNDCLVGGKGGLLHVVNGHDGSLLWHLEDQLERQQTEAVLDVYAAQYIPDVDNDGFLDVISAHTVSDLSGNIVKGHLIVISGKVGVMLRMVEMPGSSESYYAPQLLVRPDGEKIILIGTGGTASHSWGGLHAVSLGQLAGTDKVPFRTLLTSDSRGVMSPPVLIDINHDGTEDIVVSLFNSTVVAVDGKTFKTIWNFTFPDSQTFSPPTPGYFNDDDTPDFLVKYQNGPDYPVYYYSQMNILDGKTGLPLLDNSVIDSVGSQMGGLSLSVEGLGNDWFLYWLSNCEGYEGSQNPFSFAKGSDIVAQSQADVCRLRFNSTMTAALLAVNKHVDTPGYSIYSSKKRESVEYNNSKRISYEAEQYLASHPDFNSRFGAQEDGMGLTNTAGIQVNAVQNSNRQPLPPNSIALKQTPPDFNRNEKEGGIGSLGDTDYSLLKVSHLRKQSKDYNSDADSQDWRLDESAKSYGSLYESQPPEGFDQDYESPFISNNRGSSSPHLAGLFNSYPSRQEGGQSPSNYKNIFNEQRRSGTRRLVPNQIKAIKKDQQANMRFKRQGTEKLAENNFTPDKNNNSLHVPNIQKGIYPSTSTGTFVPPLRGVGMDLVLVSYWIPPSEGVQILTEKDIECTKQGVERAANDETDKYANMDQESVELAITAECLYQRLSTDTSLSNDGRLEPHPGFMSMASSVRSSTHKTLNIRLGQLTVYRLNIQCKCHKADSEYESCAKVLPFNKQRWPSYMGHGGRGYFHQN
ncbi:Protein FAM234B [Frankliniella fusca]|uniref:Protein FAM234B n=1 Tax=Frankliniella fusca TaxID=407009 RepID=A0AAE1HWJ7_9NEOP|nr:Protein FAM234B [Frankliniella fusca]